MIYFLIYRVYYIFLISAQYIMIQYRPFTTTVFRTFFERSKNYFFLISVKL
jgi:hypothetical protein